MNPDRPSLEASVATPGLQLLNPLSVHRVVRALGVGLGPHGSRGARGHVHAARCRPVGYGGGEYLLVWYILRERSVLAIRRGLWMLRMLRMLGCASDGPSEDLPSDPDRIRTSDVCSVDI